MLDSLELPAVLESELCRLSEYVGTVLENHLAACVELQTFVQGGKHLRARLLFATASMYAPPPVSQDTLHAAAAVELLHAASLVHDDIVDGCAVRRGAPTRFEARGSRVAAREGMQLAQLALFLIAELPTAARRRAAEVARSLSKGQLTEIVRAHDLGLSPEERLTIMEQKTASVFGLVCELGGIVACAPSDQWAQLERLGTSFGMLFQIADDLADLLASWAELGRPPGADLRSGVISLPIAFALQSDARHLVEEIVNDQDSPSAAVSRLQELLRVTNSLELTHGAARNYASVALRQCSALPPSLGRRWIQSLVQKMLGRVERLAHTPEQSLVMT